MCEMSVAPLSPVKFVVFRIPRPDRQRVAGQTRILARGPLLVREEEGSSVEGGLEALLPRNVKALLKAQSTAAASKI